MSNVGINVIETDGSASPAIAGAPTSVAGVLLRSQRGPTGTAVRVSSFRQFAQRFGAHDRRFTGAYAMEGLFGNGGREAHVARVIGSGSATARVTLLDRGGNGTLRVGAGYRGAEEPGEWGNQLYLDVRDNPEFSTALAADRAGATPARLQGNAFAASTVNLTVPSGNPARRVRIAVDGSQNLDVTLDASAVPVLAAATPEDVATAINRVAGARAVAQAAQGGLRLVSRTKGAASSIEAAAGVDDPTRTLLGLNLPAAAGAAAPAGTYDEVQLESLAGFAVGDWMRLDDGITSDWLQITALEERQTGGGQTELFARFAQPVAADQREYRRADGATASTVEFDLLVSRQEPADPAPLPVEVWEKLSMAPTARRYAPTVVNDEFSGSGYVVLTDQNPASSTGRDAPALGTGVRLGLATPATSALVRQAGADGGDPTPANFTAAMARLDTTPVQLLLAPELMADAVLQAVTRAALDYCSARGDCTFIGHTPPKRDQAGAKTFGQRFRSAKVYGALYWPWITVTDPIGAGTAPTLSIPPSGHVAGIFARTDQLRGVWKAPAGDQALVRGALDVESSVTDEDHTDLVKNGSINGIRPIQGVGIALDASRTLSTDTRWLYVNVRLLFNYVKSSLREGLRWAKQEPNREPLWGMIKFGSVTPFLLRLYQAGAFGPGTPDEVFTVICGRENNPPDQIALGNLQVEVYFYPSRPAETILIVVGQQESGATAAER
jgi:phage tail sheath protein FI